MRMMALMAAVVVALAGVAEGQTTAAADKVTVRTEQKTYPVRASTRAKPRFAPIEKLKGKTEYTTTAVVLENRFLRLTVLPEFGGRLVNAIYKPTNAQMFWVHDEISDDVSWSMSGCRVSFPFWEHGRHFDETAGYATVTNADGSITLALDMRFNAFVKPEETQRYGRATNLRLAQFFTLAPNESRFTWRTKVDNPLPVPCGFKLWTLLRQPNKAGIQTILPTVGVTGHGATALEKWEPAVVGTAQFSKFAIGMTEGFAGWYLPEQDLNVLTIRDPKVVPGAKQVLYPAKDDARGYIEMWHGSHEVFEEPGRLLPAFGSYDMMLTVAASQGQGKEAHDPPAGPLPEEHFKHVQALVKSDKPGGAVSPGAYAEAMDLVTETQLNLIRYAPTAEKILSESSDPADLVAAARRLWRVKNAPNLILRGLAKVPAGSPAYRQAALVRALALLEDKATPEVLAAVLKDAKVPGGWYLRALAGMQTNDNATAMEMLKALEEAKPADSLLKADLELLQPGAYLGNTQPRLLRAILCEKAGQSAEAKATLTKLVADDPACIEAWMLLGDKERVATLTAHNPAGQKAAEENLANLRAGRFAGVLRP